MSVDVFEALDAAETDQRLAYLRSLYVEDRIDVSGLERGVEQRLDELLHADEQSERQQLEDAIEFDLVRMGYPPENGTCFPTRLDTDALHRPCSWRAAGNEGSIPCSRYCICTCGTAFPAPCPCVRGQELRPPRRLP